MIKEFTKQDLGGYLYRMSLVDDTLGEAVRYVVQSHGWGNGLSAMDVCERAADEVWEVDDPGLAGYWLIRGAYTGPR